MLLDVNNISVSYGSFKALHGVSLQVNEGEIVALLGSNGAGKTTTIKTISGQLIQTGGDIIFNGENIKDLPIYERVERGIVQVPEGRRLFPWMSVHDNLLAGSYAKSARPFRDETLEMCYQTFPKLAERRKQMAGSLSGGEQQMVAIARGLMQKPKIMMLDEPSLGLAPIVVEEIFEVLQTINKQGVTILLVEQNVGFSLAVADRIYVIETGENIMSGTGEEMRHNEDLKKAYLSV